MYLSLNGWAILTPSYILQHCTVGGQKLEDISDDNFYCKSAINAQRGLYYKLDWEHHRRTALASKNVEGDPWTVEAKDEIKDKPSRSKSSSPKKRPIKKESSDEEGEDISDDEYSHRPSTEDKESSEDDMETIEWSECEDEDDNQISLTPSKRKRMKAQSTPKRPRRTLAAPTPHSKAALRARRKRANTVAIKPRPDQALDFMQVETHNLPDDPWLRAMQVLHVGSRPDALPCRDEQYTRILRSVEDLLDEGSGGCVCMFYCTVFLRCTLLLQPPTDISGVPGTGKTATVHRIVRELKHMAERSVRLSRTLAPTSTH